MSHSNYNEDGSEYLDWYLDFIKSDRRWTSYFLEDVYTYPLKLEFTNKHSFALFTEKHKFINYNLVIYED